MHIIKKGEEDATGKEDLVKVVVVEVVSLGHGSSGLPLAFQDGMDGPSISWNRLGLG